MDELSPAAPAHDDLQQIYRLACPIIQNSCGVAPDSVGAGPSTGLLVAAHAAVAFADSRKISQFKAALVNRDIIGQVKGVLMGRHRISAQQAFSLIATVGSRTNITLMDIAERLTTSGELPQGHTKETRRTS